MPVFRISENADIEYVLYKTISSKRFYIHVNPHTNSRMRTRRIESPTKRHPQAGKRLTCEKRETILRALQPPKAG